MPLTISNPNSMLSSWITHLLIQELNDNNPVTTELILNYFNDNNINYTPNTTSNITPNITPNTTSNVTPNTTSNVTPNTTSNVTPNTTSNVTPNNTPTLPSTIIIDHTDDQYLYDTDYSSDYDSPTSIIDFPNHNIP
tara:strand:+ start:117 stop:527 length:411 start_codon:yes stop_codon:yes gene_type:complete